MLAYYFYFIYRRDSAIPILKRGFQLDCMNLTFQNENSRYANVFLNFFEEDSLSTSAIQFRNVACQDTNVAHYMKIFIEMEGRKRKPLIDAQQLLEIKTIKQVYLSHKDHYHSNQLMKEILDRAIQQLLSLYDRGKVTKLLALYHIYSSFKALDPTDEKSRQACREVINSNYDDLKSFDSDCGKLVARIKQSIFQPEYPETMNKTQILVIDLKRFIT